jgi:hypothetical protein
LRPKLTQSSQSSSIESLFAILLFVASFGILRPQARAQLVQITQVSQPPRPACETKDLSPAQKVQVELFERRALDARAQSQPWKVQVSAQAVRQRWNSQREVCELRIRFDASRDCWRWNRWQNSQAHNLSCENGEVWLTLENDWANAPRAAGEASANQSEQDEQNSNASAPTLNARPRLDNCGLTVARRLGPRSAAKSALARQACVDRESRVWRSRDCRHKVCDPSLSPPPPWSQRQGLAEGLCQSFGGKLSVFNVHPQPITIESCEFGEEQFISPSLILDRLSFPAGANLRLRLLDTKK